MRPPWQTSQKFISIREKMKNLLNKGKSLFNLLK